MKIKRALLIKGIESPFNENKLDSSMFDLEVLKSDGIGILRAIPKSRAVGAGPWDFPLSSVAGWQSPEQVPAKK